MQMASHVAADAHLDLRWFGQAKMRKEAGDLMQPIKIDVDPLGQGLQLGFRQIAELMLKLVQFLNDHGASGFGSRNA